MRRPTVPAEFFCRIGRLGGSVRGAACHTANICFGTYPRGSRAVGDRELLALAFGEAPCPSVTACLLRRVGHQMGLRRDVIERFGVDGARENRVDALLGQGMGKFSISHVDAVSQLVNDQLFHQF